MTRKAKDLSPDQKMAIESPAGPFHCRERGTSVAAFSSCLLTVTFHPLTPGSFKGDMTVKDKAGNGPQAVSLSGRAQ